jgi:hypothetical protein
MEVAAHNAAKMVDDDAVKGMGHEWTEFLRHANEFVEKAFANILKEKFKGYGASVVEKMGASVSAADGSEFAYVEDTGTHRNGVKPWEEYEDVWFAQKLDSRKTIQDFSQSTRH